MCRAAASAVCLSPPHGPALATSFLLTWHTRVLIQQSSLCTIQVLLPAVTSEQASCHILPFVRGCLLDERPSCFPLAIHILHPSLQSALLAAIALEDVTALLLPAILGCLIRVSAAADPHSKDLTGTQGSPGSGLWAGGVSRGPTQPASAEPLARESRQVEASARLTAALDHSGSFQFLRLSPVGAGEVANAATAALCGLVTQVGSVACGL